MLAVDTAETATARVKAAIAVAMTIEGANEEGRTTTVGARALRAAMTAVGTIARATTATARAREAIAVAMTVMIAGVASGGKAAGAKDTADPVKMTAAPTAANSAAIDATMTAARAGTTVMRAIARDVAMIGVTIADPAPSAPIAAGALSGTGVTTALTTAAMTVMTTAIPRGMSRATPRTAISPTAGTCARRIPTHSDLFPWALTARHRRLFGRRVQLVRGQSMLPHVLLSLLPNPLRNPR